QKKTPNRQVCGFWSMTFLSPKRRHCHYRKSKNSSHMRTELLFTVHSKPLKKKVLFTVFRKTQLPNTNCAATKATKIHTKTGICIFTVTSVSKRRAGTISFCKKTSKGISELMKSGYLRKVFAKIVLMKLCNSIAQR